MGGYCVKLLGVVLCLVGTRLYAQGVSVAPSAIEIRSVEGWTVGAGTFALQSSGNWWVKVDAGWLSVRPSSGTGPATIKVALVDALQLRAGDFTARVTYGVGGTETPTGTATVTLKLLKSAYPPPVYSYLDGPNGCTKTPGYEDAGVCQVPGEKPPGNFAPPGVGGTYKDQNFGAMVRIVTKPTSWHSYSTPSALNANNEYLLFSASTQWTVGEAFTGRIIRDNSSVGEGSMWDAVNPNLLYSIRGPRVESYDVANNRTTVVVDYSSTNPRFTSISNGGAGDTSKDNWISFYAPTEKQICALSLTTASTYCASYENRGPVVLDPRGRGTLISKGIDSESKKRYVLLIAYPAMAVFSVNEKAARLDFEYLAPERVDATGNGNGICEPNESCYVGEHTDTMEDAQGIQYLVGAMEVGAPCSFGIHSFRLSRPNLLAAQETGGGARRLVTLQNCGGIDPWVDLHLSCAKSAPTCAASTTYGGFNAARDPGDVTPVRRTAHLSEVFVIQNNGAEVRRLAQHRSMTFKNEPANGYWSTPRASISYDGAWVVYTSNFGEPNQQRVAIVETGFAQSSIAGVYDSTLLGTTLAPGGLASIFGRNLANCSQAANQTPLPTEVCGATVKVGALPSHLLYASSTQINFLVPKAVDPGQPTTLVVQRGPTLMDQAVWALSAVSIKENAPAVFTYRLDDGVDRAVVQNYDVQTRQVTLNGPGAQSTAPQRPGQIGIVYATNLGATDPTVEEGMPTPFDPLLKVTSPVDVLVNGFRQDVLFAGLTPGFAGLYQVNYLLKLDTPIGGATSDRIWLVAGGQESPQLPISLAPVLP